MLHPIHVLKKKVPITKMISTIWYCLLPMVKVTKILLNFLLLLIPKVFIKSPVLMMNCWLKTMKE